MAHQQQLPRRPRARRGFVLAVVLWMMVILLILVLSLAYDTQLSSSGTTNNDQQARAYYAAMSGVERLAAALDEASADTETLYTAPGQPWERIDSDEEPIAPEAAMYQYRVIAEDNCARVDLNEVDEAGLQTLTDLTPEQVASIVDYNGGAATGATTPATGAGTAATGATGTPTAFRSVDDLLLLPGFTAGELYGAASWQERLSPTERFRQEWTQLAAGGTTTPDAATAQPLADRFGVGARARRIDSMGQPRLELSTVTQEELQTRLEAIAEKLQVTQDQAPSDSGGRRRGGGGGSPVTAGLRIIRNRNVRNWSQVWGAVQNNRSAVRLLADVLTLPNDDPNAPAIADDGGGGGGGRPGGGGGRPGGGGGRPGGGGGGRPGGGGPGGGFPGGGGGGGGFPGGGGGRGGGGGPRGALLQSPSVGVLPAVYRPRAGGFSLLLAQAPGGQPGGPGSQPGAPGAGGDTGSTSSTGTVTATTPMEGAINLNTAPPEVLMTLPQMTEEVAQLIVSYRETTPFVSRGDLLQIPELTQQVFNQIIERVTVVSDSYTVRSLGFARTDPAGMMRPTDIAVHLTAVLDRSTGRCRIVRLRQDN